MNLAVEDFSTHQKILIVDKNQTELSKQLKALLEKYDNDIYLSPHAPQNLDKFEYCFFVNESKHLFEKVLFHNKGKYIFFLHEKDKKTEQFIKTLHSYKKNHVKLIIYSDEYLSEEDIEKVFWFAFTPNTETSLRMHFHHATRKPHPKPVVREPFKFRFGKKHLKLIIALAFFAVLIGHFVFVPHLLLSSWKVYQATIALKAQDMDKVSTLTTEAANDLETARYFYIFSRPTFLFFSIASLPDNGFETNKLSLKVINEAIDLYTQGTKYTNLVLKKAKSPEEQEVLSKEQNELAKQLRDLQSDLGFLKQKIPEWHPVFKKTKDEIGQMASILDTGARLLPFADKVLAKNTTKHYLLMFANNMELRPGGGFIGSFAIVTAKDYGIDHIEVYDVYDADGQLKAHIEPPEAIKKYLNQPHWFLRDSAFSPDFSQNYSNAKMFLAKEMNLSNFDGAFLLTTTSIQNVMEAIGDVYVPDFKEVVNKDNFYMKAQYYAEHDFFPGSTQKKRFLGAVLNQMTINIEDTSPLDLLDMITKSLNEKQIVLYFDDPEIQAVFDQQYWSGKMIQPVCTSNSKNCIVDYLMPVEANLGVNKANFYINRVVTLNVSIDSKGKIKNRFIMQLTNESPKDTFPGGVYRNYLQVYLPANVHIKQITKNGTLVEQYDKNERQHTSVGFLVEIQPQASSEIVIDYELNSVLEKGKGVYQLIVQKQIGSGNYDFSFSLSLGNGVYTVNQNFSPLVKENTIHYNTSIKTDKIFFVELLKE